MMAMMMTMMMMMMVMTMTPMMITMMMMTKMWLVMQMLMSVKAIGKTKEQQEHEEEVGSSKRDYANTRSYNCGLRVTWRRRPAQLAQRLVPAVGHGERVMSSLHRGFALVGPSAHIRSWDI